MKNKSKTKRIHMQTYILEKEIWSNIEPIPWSIEKLKNLKQKHTLVYKIFDIINKIRHFNA